MSTTNFYPHSLPGLTDREAVIDAVIRACHAIDVRDKALWDSAWSTTRSSEVSMPITGRETIKGKEAIDALFGIASRLDTHHMTSSIRAWIHEGGETASLTAAATNQHYPAGEGIKGGTERAFIAGSRYEVALVREEGG
ncbi:hypothetical protein BDZ90DRAFT_260927 [Jaminaea rosea]|uniref:SnoaL-like domain-containing protein n=1 Tax=Jaminaea rosea TaxID=1569628 RepID=A0A316US13_9BASI|nr:hypothetical protein BDZ90DRAFT_260927 [Jaminaea rosea]PWN26663.1 hypothetical protein BDZ90DRAFT_260927 [Jaminaea rosea]